MMFDRKKLWLALWRLIIAPSALARSVSQSLNSLFAYNMLTPHFIMFTYNQYQPCTLGVYTCKMCISQQLKAVASNCNSKMYDDDNVVCIQWHRCLLHKCQTSLCECWKVKVQCITRSYQYIHCIYIVHIGSLMTLTYSDSASASVKTSHPTPPTVFIFITALPLAVWISFS